ncbi:MAG TPA: hypothetical protein VH572_07615 [Gaiella sp.]|jgi:hypothetical protein
MIAITIYLDAGGDEAEELQDRLADIVDEHVRAEPGELAYVVTLSVPFEVPEDDDELIELTAGGARRVLFGPAVADEGEALAGVAA